MLIAHQLVLACAHVLQADLAQQVQDRARREPGKLDLLLEQALIVSSKPEPAAVKEQKRRQQAEYRCVLLKPWPACQAPFNMHTVLAATRVWCGVSCTNVYGVQGLLEEPVQLKLQSDVQLLQLQLLWWTWPGSATFGRNNRKRQVQCCHGFNPPVALHSSVSVCRACLDAQAAAKGRQQHCDQLEQQQLWQQHKQRVQEALGAANDPCTYC